MVPPGVLAVKLLGWGKGTAFLLWSQRAPPQPIDQHQAAGCMLGTPAGLLAYRLACFLVGVALGIPDLRPAKLIYGTTWNWLLLTAYFGAAAAASARVVLLPGLLRIRAARLTGQAEQGWQLFLRRSASSKLSLAGPEPDLLTQLGEERTMTRVESSASNDLGLPRSRDASWSDFSSSGGVASAAGNGAVAATAAAGDAAGDAWLCDHAGPELPAAKVHQAQGAEQVERRRLEQAMWAMYHVAGPMVIFIDAWTWAVLVPMLLSSSGADPLAADMVAGMLSSGYRRFDFLMKHAFNFVMLLGEGLLNRMPLTFRLSGWLWLWGSLYATWTGIHFFAQGRPVYPFLDLHQPGAWVNYVAIYLAHVAAFFIFMGLVKAKEAALNMLLGSAAPHAAAARPVLQGGLRLQLLKSKAQ